jgi:hypothetical protein
LANLLVQPMDLVLKMGYMLC